MEKRPSNKTSASAKSMNMDIWVDGTSNQQKINKFFKKIKQLLPKLRSLWQVHFVLPILFVLTLAFERTVLYGSDAISVLVLSTETPVFLKKVEDFQKMYFKVTALKMFKISSVCRIKICRSLKRRAILKIPSTVFQKNLCSFCWLQNEISKKKRFPVLRQNQLKFCCKSCWKEQPFMFCLFNKSPF